MHIPIRIPDEVLRGSIVDVSSGAGAGPTASVNEDASLTPAGNTSPLALEEPSSSSAAVSSEVSNLDSLEITEDTLNATPPVAAEGVSSSADVSADGIDSLESFASGNANEVDDARVFSPVQASTPAGEAERILPRRSTRLKRVTKYFGFSRM